MSLSLSTFAKFTTVLKLHKQDMEQKTVIK